MRVLEFYGGAAILALAVCVSGSCAQYGARTGAFGLIIAAGVGSGGPYTLSVIVSGHTGGAGLAVVNQSGSETINGINSNGTFAFSQQMYRGIVYDVQIASQPAGQTCQISVGSGTMGDADVVLPVVCGPQTFTLSGTVTGFTAGSNLVLIEGTSSQTINIGAGATNYVFATPVVNGATYNISVQTQPTTPSQTCSVSNSGGTISGANVTNVDVNCVTGTLVGGNIQIVPTLGTGLLTTIGGKDTLSAPANTPVSGNTNATGNAARFNSPHRITTDGTNLYITDTGNGSIRKMVISTGVVTTITSGLTAPEGITTDGANLYVSDSTLNVVYLIPLATGVATQIAGGNTGGGVSCAGTNFANCKDGNGTAAEFSGPRAITTDGTNLYLADRANDRVRKIVIASRVVSTLAGDGNTATLGAVDGLCYQGGSLYATDTTSGSVVSITTAGGVIATLFPLGQPRGISTDGTNLYITSLGHTIWKYDSLLAGGSLTTLSGLTATSGFVDGALGPSRMNDPRGITSDGVSLYITDTLNHSIRRYK